MRVDWAEKAMPIHLLLITFCGLLFRTTLCTFKVLFQTSKMGFQAVRAQKDKSRVRRVYHLFISCLSGGCVRNPTKITSEPKNEGAVTIHLIMLPIWNHPLLETLSYWIYSSCCLARLDFCIPVLFCLILENYLLASSLFFRITLKHLMNGIKVTQLSDNLTSL